MESFKATLENELFRLFKKKKAVVVLALAVGLIAFVLLVSVVLRGSFGILGGTGSAFPLTVLQLFSNTILPLFMALAVIDTFTGEFASDTMKITITKPVTRLKIYLAKLAAVGVFVLVNLGVVMVLSMLVAIVFYTKLISVVWALNVIVAYVATFVPMMVLAVVVAYFANVFKSSTGVFFLSVLVFVVLRALGVVPALSPVLITSLLEWYGLWIAKVLPIGSIVRSLIVFVAYLMVFGALGYRRFDKRAL